MGVVALSHRRRCPPFGCCASDAWFSPSAARRLREVESWQGTRRHRSRTRHVDEGTEAPGGQAARVTPDQEDRREARDEVLRGWRRGSWTGSASEGEERQTRQEECAEGQACGEGVTWGSERQARRTEVQGARCSPQAGEEKPNRRRIANDKGAGPDENGGNDRTHCRDGGIAFVRSTAKG